MNKPKKQHWVPRFYLKHFSTSESRGKKVKQVWVFDKETDSEPTLVNVDNICAKRYLYSPMNDDEKRDWFLEEKLSRLESVLADVWPDLANEYIDIVTDEPLRKGISLFVSTMMLRNPDTRILLEDTYQKIVKLVEDEPDINDISAIEINGVENKFTIDEWGMFKNRKENDHHKFFTSYIQSEVIHIAEKMLKKRWSILFSEKPFFITSDKPVSIQHLTKNTFGVDFGLDTEGTFIMFPISPSRILIMDDMHNEPAGQYYPLKDNSHGSYNLLTWKNSRRFMISSRDINVVLKEMLNEFDS